MATSEESSPQIEGLDPLNGPQIDQMSQMSQSETDQSEADQAQMGTPRAGRQRRRATFQQVQQEREDIRQDQAVNFMQALDLEVQKDIYESCLEHLDDFEDGPVGFGQLNRELEPRLIWTKEQKCVFVSLISRRSPLQLEKIASVVGKSPIECQAYLDLLQAGVEYERLPPLRYVDIPAAIEVPEEDIEDLPSQHDAYSMGGVVEDGTAGLIDLKQLGLLTDLSLTEDVVEILTAYVIRFVEAVLSRLQFASITERHMEWLLDQHFEIPADVSTQQGELEPGPRAFNKNQDAVRLKILQNAWRFLYNCAPPDTLEHKGEKIVVPKEEETDDTHGGPSAIPEATEEAALRESDSDEMYLDDGPSSRPTDRSSFSLETNTHNGSHMPKRPHDDHSEMPSAKRQRTGSESSTDREDSEGLRAFLNKCLLPGPVAISEVDHKDSGDLFVAEEEQGEVDLSVEDVDPLLDEEAAWLDEFDRYVGARALGKTAPEPEVPRKMVEAFMETL